MAAAPSDATTELAPVALHERIALFDVFRGFCLFGMLWSNLNDAYTIAPPVTGVDHAIQWTQDWLVEMRLTVCWVSCSALALPPS